MNVPSGWKRRDVQISVVLVLLTLVVLAMFLDDPKDPWARRLIAAAWVGWALVPPAYFLFEWSRFTDDSPEGLTRLKYNHELASKFWLAGATVFSAVLLKLW